MSKWLAYGIILLLQIILFNHLDFSAYLFPQIFVIILIGLPIHWNKNGMIGVAFGLGLLIDLLIGTPGLNASACLLIMLLKLAIMDRLDTTNIIADRSHLSPSTLGPAVYLRISAVLLFIYHAYVFLIENIGALHFSGYIFKVLLSTVLSLLVIYILQLIFYRDFSAKA